MLSAWLSRDRKIYTGYRTAEPRSEVSNTGLSAAQPFEVGVARKCFLPLLFQPLYVKIYFFLMMTHCIQSAFILFTYKIFALGWNL
jgi:hypothetical protein